MEKTQSLLAALFGWFIGSFTMWRLGFDTPIALLGGLLVGAPLAYIAYDPKTFGITFRQQSELATMRYGYFPRIKIPSFARAVEVARTTASAGFIVCLWILQACVVTFWTQGSAGDGSTEGNFFVHLVASLAVSAMCTLIFVLMIGDNDAPWGRWLRKREKARNALKWVALSLGLLNFPILFALGGIVLTILVVVVSQDVTIRVCCSGRLISMTSTVIGLLLEWSFGNIAVGLGGLLASFAVQRFVLHDWATEQERNGRLLNW